MGGEPSMARYGARHTLIRPWMAEWVSWLMAAVILYSCASDLSSEEGIRSRVLDFATLIRFCPRPLDEIHCLLLWFASSLSHVTPPLFAVHRSPFIIPFLRQPVSLMPPFKRKTSTLSCQLDLTGVSITQYIITWYVPGLASRLRSALALAGEARSSSLLHCNGDHHLICSRIGFNLIVRSP